MIFFRGNSTAPGFVTAIESHQAVISRRMSIIYLCDDNSIDWCPDLKMNWFNFGSKEEIPLEVWQTGYSSSYCGDGPIQNAAAAFATDYTSGKPIAALEAINSGEYLSGAVYKCCQDIVTCYN